MNCAIIACLKQEELYVKEWLDWHINIGVDHFYLCDNNDKDYEPKLQGVVKDYIDRGIVEVFDYSGVHPIQPICYDDIYKKYRKLYDWWLVIDIDEFICLPKYNDDLNLFLNNIPNNINKIFLFWKRYGDSDLIEYDDRPCLERFTKPSKVYCSKLGKSLFRNTINRKIINQHTIFIESTYNCNFERLNYEDREIIENTYNVVYIKHFVTKSLEEWIWKHDRGSCVILKTDKKYPYKLHNYWGFNEKTPEKIKYLKQYELRHNSMS